MKAAKTYIIQNKETKELFQARSGKTSWKAPGHAKNAWNQSWFSIEKVEAAGMQMIESTSRYRQGVGLEFPKFDQQDVFEIVELKHESQDRLEQAIVLLNKTLGRCDYDIHNEIVEFLNEEV